MCEICGQLVCPPACPNYEPKVVATCSVCGEPIIFGDRSVVNCDCDIAHIECVDATEEALIWCGCTIKETEDDYE